MEQHHSNAIDFIETHLHATNYESKRTKCNHIITNLCTKYGLKFVKHQITKVLHMTTFCNTTIITKAMTIIQAME